MRTIQLSNHDEIQEFKKAQRAKILSAYGDTHDNKTARLITKAEFDEEFPEGQYERYSLVAIDKFRQDIMKSEDIDDKEGAFKKATSDLKSFVISEGDNKAIVFVRKKEAGE